MHADSGLHNFFLNLQKSMFSFELNLTYQEANTPDQHHFLMPIFCPSFTTELFAFPPPTGTVLGIFLPSPIIKEVLVSCV